MQYQWADLRLAKLLWRPIYISSPLNKLSFSTVRQTTPKLLLTVWRLSPGGTLELRFLVSMWIYWRWRYKVSFAFSFPFTIDNLYDQKIIYFNISLLGICFWSSTYLESGCRKRLRSRTLLGHAADWFYPRKQDPCCSVHREPDTRRVLLDGI